MKQIKIEKQIMVRDSRALETYLKDISKIEMITPEQEVELAKAIQQGCEKSLQKLTAANLRFAVSIAKKYRTDKMPLCDLIQYANLGLLKAAKRFDHTRGFKFISYAVWWIRQTIIEAIQQEGGVIRIMARTETTLKNLVDLRDGIFNDAVQARIKKLGYKYDAETGCFSESITDDELCQILNVSQSELATAKRSDIHVFSMDKPIDADNEMYFEAVGDIHSDALIDAVDSKEQIKELLSVLPARDRDLIKMLFGIGHDKHYTIRDVAEIQKCTHQNICIRRDKAIIKMRMKQRQIFSKELQLC